MEICVCTCVFDSISLRQIISFFLSFFFQCSAVARCHTFNDREVRFQSNTRRSGDLCSSCDWDATIRQGPRKGRRAITAVLDTRIINDRWPIIVDCFRPLVFFFFIHCHQFINPNSYCMHAFCLPPDKWRVAYYGLHHQLVFLLQNHHHSSVALVAKYII